MYSLLLSKIEALGLLKDLKENIINQNSRILILPWSFPVELDSDRLMNEYFVENGNRYNRYFLELKKFGVTNKNISIGNCYLNDNSILVKQIENSDIILLPGGNPEMLMNKILHKTELLYKIKHYDGIIIGESAGCLLQLERYFIMAENNYYKYFAFYDGIGVINNQILFDVHSKDDPEYIDKLQEVSKKVGKDVYAIFDAGCVLYNRKTEDIRTFGNVIKISLD